MLWPSEYDRVFSRLNGVIQSGPTEWKSLCPLHADTHPSLVWSIGKLGDRLVFNCLAGCTKDDAGRAALIRSLNLSWAMLYADYRENGQAAGSGSVAGGKSAGARGGKGGKARVQQKVTATFRYEDQAGNLIYEVRRLEPARDGRSKEFAIYHLNPANGRMIRGAGGNRPILYRLSELAASAKLAPPPPVFIVEGERKADKLTAAGFVATCCAGGAGKWHADYSFWFRGRHVVILPDNDPPGMEHARTVAESLAGHAASIKIVQLPGLPAKGDILDWAAIPGNGPARLRELVEATPEWLPAISPATEGSGASGPAGKSDITISDSPSDSTDPSPSIKSEDDPHRLARLILNDLRHPADNALTIANYRGEIHRWIGGRWTAIDREEIRAHVRRRIEREFSRLNAARLAAPSFSDNGPPAAKKVTATIVRDVMGAIESETLIESHVEQPCWIEERGGELRPASPRDRIACPFPATEVFATQTALIHLPSLIDGSPSLLPPTPRFFSANAVEYAFDAEAECPQWERFLAETWPNDPSSIDALAEWFGYLLLPDTSQHKLLMVVGPTRSGKGVIGRTLKALVGPGNLASPTLSDLAGPFGLQSLIGRTVALVSDARLSGRADAVAIAERLLSISGEDPQDVHRKHLRTLTGVKLPVRFVLTTNELPSLTDASGALNGRVVLLRMTRSHLGSEDRGLGDRILRELPGILNWAIRGWHALRERGSFTQPETGRELLDDLADLSSPVGQFIRERCITGPEFSIIAADLFAAWKEWCDANGREHPGTASSFSRLLRANAPSLKVRRPRFSDGQQRRVFDGVALKPDNDFETPRDSIETPKETPYWDR